MKELLFIFMILLVTSPASASVYKWVDDRGVTNYTEDISKVPTGYRDRVEEVNIAITRPSTPSKTSPEYIKGSVPLGKTSKQAPPISQPLVREGDFAIKLVESLKMGRVESEAEAESMLSSVGIAPQNGWIADYPVTPDIIGELEKAIGEAADAGRLGMEKNEALKAFRGTALELELPIIAEIPERYDDRYADIPPPVAPEYIEPLVINNYYYDGVPPVVTYYPPPPDYYYLYAWLPSPFWFSGFYFPGYFILHDFHRVVYINRYPCVITNHIRDHNTGRIFTINPLRRHEGRTFGVRDSRPTRGFISTEARSGARSIVERSHERMARGNAPYSTRDRRLNNGNPGYSGSGQGTDRQTYSRERSPSEVNRGRTGDSGRQPAVERRMGRTPNETGSRGMGDRNFSRPESMNRQSGMNLQRTPSGETRSFSPPARGSERSFSPPPQSRGQQFNSPPVSGRGFAGSYQGGDRSRAFSPQARGGERSFSPSPQGGGQPSNPPPMRSRGFAGSQQGGGHGSAFSPPTRGSERSFSLPPQAGGQQFNSPSINSRGSSGYRQGGDRSSPFGSGKFGF